MALCSDLRRGTGLCGVWRAVAFVLPPPRISISGVTYDPLKTTVKYFNLIFEDDQA